MSDCPIPVEWHAALEANPTDATLRSALADYLQEQGDDLAAEAIRFSVEKGAVPRIREGGDCAIWDREQPMTLFHKTPSYRDYKWPNFVDAYRRLILKWKNSTPAEREGYWKWNPSHVVS